MPWFPFLLVDLHSILYHIVPYGCAALFGKWRGQGHHPPPVSILFGRTSNANDISIKTGRLKSCGETRRLLRILRTKTPCCVSRIAPIHRIGDIQLWSALSRRQRGWTRKIAVLSRLGFAPSSSPENASDGTLGSLHDRISFMIMIELVLTYVLQCYD